MSDLDRIAAGAPEIARRSVEAMWRDPFWSVRFGDRGIRYATEDARHHVTWLVEALRADRPEILVDYARWLRGVLATRGMCTAHLADHLLQIGAAVDAIGLDDDGRARAFLRAAAAGLDRAAGDAALVDAAAATLAADGDRTRAHRARHHLSYLADALDLGRPELFADHVRFARAATAAFGGPDEVDATLRALAARVPAGREVVLGALE